MPEALQRSAPTSCPACDTPVNSLEVVNAFFVTRPYERTHGPGPLAELPSPGHDGKIEPARPEDRITLGPCGCTFPRYAIAEWLDAYVERCRAAAAERLARAEEQLRAEFHLVVLTVGGADVKRMASFDALVDAVTQHAVKRGALNAR